MTIKELGDTLSQMYNDENAPKNEKVTRIILFGIKYSDEIKNLGRGAVKQIIQQSVLSMTKYGAEVNKGINLAKYVVLK